MSGAKVETAVQWKTTTSTSASASSAAAGSSWSSMRMSSSRELPRRASRVTSIDTSGGSIARSSGSATELPEGISTPARSRLP
jgi:hypothetical protein